MQTGNIKRVIIAGGGTAGWMAAAALSKTLGKVLDIKLIESDQIGTVGVGEATIPTLVTYLRLLGIEEKDFMAATQATFKLGIAFENWREVDHSYIHSFGITGKDHWTTGFQHFWRKGFERNIVSDYGDYCLELKAALEGKFAHLPNLGLNYAFHLDASLFAKFLRVLSEKHGVERIEGKINSVKKNGENGFIESLTLESGHVIDGDLFIDCTGFRGLLIEDALHTGYDDWTHYLPCDTAVAVQTNSVDDPVPYTRSIGRDAGWQWRIPLQSRVGNGHVFCSHYMTVDEGREVLLNNIDGKALTDPLVIKFRTGTRRKHWNKNCIALGLASGFIEPLESTSIHLIQRSVLRLCQMFPSSHIAESDVKEFNRQCEFEMDGIRDFIVLHYHVTDRTDTPFWRHCKDMNIPDSLQHRIDLFRETGRVFRHSDELFAENSWTQVMLGQGIMPCHYHPTVDMLGDDELMRFLDHIRDNVTKTVESLPRHHDYIQQYCKAPKL